MSATRLQINLSAASISWEPVPHGVAFESIEARSGGIKPLFDAIDKGVIGGAALSGGKGTVLGSLLGVVLMAMLTNVLNLSGVNMYWQNVFVGVILIVVVAVDSIIAPKETR